MTPPTISAVVRVYNGEKYIGDTLTAVLSQSCPPDEVVVVDDGSTDGTPGELLRFRGRIRVIHQPNSGVAATFNRCFEEARGDYVAICDADDVWMPDKLERQIAAVMARPEIDIAFAAVWIFGADDSPWGLLDTTEPGILEPRQFARDLFRADVVSTSTVLIRSRLHRQLGLFEEHQGGAEDWDYWLRALRAGAVFYYDPAVLVRYRRHDGQITSSRLRVEQAGHEVRSLHADLVGDRKLARSVRAETLFRIGRLLVDDGRPVEARRAFRHALRYASGAQGSRSARSFGWFTVLSLPAGLRAQSGETLVRLSRALDQLRGDALPRLP